MQSVYRTFLDNIHTNVEGIECEGVEWIHLAQDSVQFLVRLNNVMISLFQKVQDISYPGE
jgi:hypothetical protein